MILRHKKLIEYSYQLNMSLSINEAVSQKMRTITKHIKLCFVIATTNLALFLKK